MSIVFYDHFDSLRTLWGDESDRWTRQELLSNREEFLAISIGFRGTDRAWAAGLLHDGKPIPSVFSMSGPPGVMEIFLHPLSAHSLLKRKR